MKKCFYVSNCVDAVVMLLTYMRLNEEFLNVEINHLNSTIYLKHIQLFIVVGSNIFSCFWIESMMLLCKHVDMSL